MKTTKETLAYINPNKLYKIETKLAPVIVLEVEKRNKKEGTPIVLGKSSDASYPFFKFRQKGENYVIETL